MTTTDTILDVPHDLDLLFDETIPDYDAEFAARRASAGIYRRYLAGVRSLCDRAEIVTQFGPVRRLEAPSGYRDYDDVLDAQIGDIDPECPAYRRRVQAEIPVGLHITNSGRPDEYLLYESASRRRQGLPPYGTITVYSVVNPGERTTFALREQEWRLINRRVLREIVRDTLDNWWQEDKDKSA